MSVLYFLLLVGALVAIHELGHFAAAKLLDFKVIRFSIGFGRPLFRVRRGETDYQVTLFPLGGYVRILGEDPTEPVAEDDRARAFSSHPLWRRLVVVLAGPGANLALPVVLYFAAFVGARDLPAAVVGDVVPSSPAARAGLEAGDRIVSLDGDSVRYWEDVEARVAGGAGRSIRFRVRRGTREIERDIAPIERMTRTRDGQRSREGWIGITHAPFSPQVGVIDPASPAARAGLVSGDLVVAIDGHPVSTWTELRRILSGPTRRRTVSYLRPVAAPTTGVEIFEPGQTGLVTEEVVGPDGARRVDHGLYPADLFVAAVEPGSPADRAGLQRGDLLTRLDGEPVAHWLVVEHALASRPEHTFQIGWRRPGEAHERSAAIHQQWRRESDVFGHPSDVLVFGAAPRFLRGHGERIAISGRFGYALSRSIERTGETIGILASGLGAIVRGQRPSDAIGGPLTVFRIASVSGDQGWEAFLLMLALVSVSVGLVNLLPVPILDGGQALLLGLEAIWRRPLSPRAHTRVHRLGLVALGMLVVLALRNDVARYIL